MPLCAFRYTLPLLVELRLSKTANHRAMVPGTYNPNPADPSWSSGLSGTIAAEIGLLTRVTKLNLYGNALSGTVPAQATQAT